MTSIATNADPTIPFDDQRYIASDSCVSPRESLQEKQLLSDSEQIWKKEIRIPLNFVWLFERVFNLAANRP